MLRVLLKVFHDLGDERIVSQDCVIRGRFLGKGAFGAVYSGSMTDRVRTKELCAHLLHSLRQCRCISIVSEWVEYNVGHLRGFSCQPWNRRV